MSYTRLVISQQGNVIDIVGEHPRRHVLVHRTVGMTRREKKWAARKWIDRHEGKPKVYASFAWTMTVDGVVHILKPLEPIRITISTSE